MSLTYLGIGSNLGDRTSHIKKAIDGLNAHGTVTRESRRYESEPWGFESSNAFINLVVEFEYEGEPIELLELISSLENHSGRVREGAGFTSRQLDIDILFFDQEVLELPDLEIPHPGIWQRRFVLRPLLDLIPDFSHPVLKKTISDLLKDCPDTTAVTPCTTTT